MRLANQQFCFSWGSDQRLAFTQETHLPKTRTQAKANAQLKLGDERTRPLPEARRADAAAHGQWAAKVLSWGLPQATTKSGNATPGRRQA